MLQIIEFKDETKVFGMLKIVCKILLKNGISIIENDDDLLF